MLNKLVNTEQHTTEHILLNNGTPSVSAHIRLVRASIQSPDEVFCRELLLAGHEGGARHHPAAGQALYCCSLQIHSTDIFVKLSCSQHEILPTLISLHSTE